MTFRRATPGDAESILQFWTASGASLSTTDEEEYVRHAASNQMAV
jgi:hypothetical protein